jgi:hypothetical protein
MRLKSIFLFVLSLEASICFGQIDEIFLNAGANLYIPINNAEKGTFPILWYDKETDPKVLIGGFNVGVSAYKQVNNKLSVKGQINLVRSVYWNEPIHANTGPSPMEQIGVYISSSQDYLVNSIFTGQFSLSDKFFIGSGLGVHVLLTSKFRLPKEWRIPETNGATVTNASYKTLVPVLPVELSYKRKKVIFTVRYEQALLNRLGKELAQYRKDSYGMLIFETGFKLK